MATPYEDVYSIFFDKIQSHPEYFNYYNLSDNDALEMAKQRAKGFLMEAIVKLKLYCTPDVDFMDKNDNLQIFNFDLTAIEKDILANLMFEMLLNKDKSKLMVAICRVTPKELNSFSPSAERNSFLNMCENVKNENMDIIDRYSSKNRITGALKIPDYSM